MAADPRCPPWLLDRMMADPHTVQLAEDAGLTLGDLATDLSGIVGAALVGARIVRPADKHN